MDTSGICHNVIVLILSMGLMIVQKTATAKIVQVVTRLNVLITHFIFSLIMLFSSLQSKLLLQFRRILSGNAQPFIALHAHIKPSVKARTDIFYLPKIDDRRF